MTKIVNMEAHTIADLDDSEEKWKFQRRRHITASDIFKFIPEDYLLEKGWWIEAWMAKDHEGNQHNMNWVRRDLMNRKETGRELTFRDPVAVKWGQVEEEHNRDLFEEYSGANCEGSHALIKNDRWPYLAGSLDGFVHKRHSTYPVRAEMFDNPGHVARAFDDLPSMSTALLEMKQTSDFGASAWFKGKKTAPRSQIIAGAFRPCPASIPVYYQAQMQTQMCIYGADYNMGVVKAGASHMTAHTLPVDPHFPKILDAINDEVAEDMERIRKVLY